MVRSTRRGFVAVMGALVLAAMAGTAAAEGRDGQAAALASLEGVWEGSAQTPNGEVSLRATLKIQDGKLGGTIESSLGVIPITAGVLDGDKLTMTIDFQGGAGTLTGKVAGSKIEGVWEVAGSTGPFALAKGGAPAAAPAAGDPVSGTWTGEVQIAGQIMPFSMMLRLSGETVAGEMTSGAGSIPISAGTWKDGALQIAFPYTAGEPVTMGAKLDGAKFVGIVDYNKGEATGTWTAARKQ
jgi:hypothetical protein